MSSVEITAGTVEPLWAYAQKASDGTALTGSSNLRVQIQRASDGYFLDFADTTFKSSGWTTRQATLTEVSSSNAPGWYKYDTAGIDTTGWSNGSYFVTFVEVSTALTLGAANFATGEIRIVTAKASDLSARLPSALVSGRIDASIGAVQSGAIGAAGFASGAITASALADDAITAAKIATDAIDADAIAASAVTEIQSGLAGASALSSVATSVASLPSAADVAAAVVDQALSGHTSTGTVGEALSRLDAAVSTRSTLTASGVWSTALPDGFSSGSAGYLIGTYLDATISSRLAGASYSAAPSASTIASQVLGTAVPGAFASGSLGYVVGTFLDLAVSSRLAASSYSSPPSVGAIADAVWDEGLAGHLTAGTAGKHLNDIAAPTAAQIAAEVWATAEGTPDAGTFGYGLWVLRMGLTNRMETTAGNPGLLKLYADDATTLLKTWQLRDKDGGAVSATSGEPAKRGAAT